MSLTVSVMSTRELEVADSRSLEVLQLTYRYHRCASCVQFEPTELSSVLLAAKVSSAVTLATTARGQIAANIIVLLTVPGVDDQRGVCAVSHLVGTSLTS